MTFHYPDTGMGIEDISLHVERGTLTVVTGRVGAGKTTLLRVLLGLLPKDRARFTGMASAVENAATFFVPPRAAYTSQVPRLFSETLRDNILLGVPDEGDILAADRPRNHGADVASLEVGCSQRWGREG